MCVYANAQHQHHGHGQASHELAQLQLRLAQAQSDAAVTHSKHRDAVEALRRERDEERLQHERERALEVR